MPWHQDRVVIMAERNDDPAYTHWSKKDGVWHCEPPVTELNQMAFAYIALDAIPAAAGGLEIAEGTHRYGKILAQNIETLVDNAILSTPALNAGDILFVHALTLHRSSVLKCTQERRALRLDFCRS